MPGVGMLRLADDGTGDKGWGTGSDWGWGQGGAGQGWALGWNAG